MMLEFVVVPLSTGSHRIVWTGTDGAVARVFLNGVLAFGPQAMAGTSKSIELSLPDPCSIEVHENADGQSVDASGVRLERKPLVWWGSVDDATRYLLSRSGVAFAWVQADPDVVHYEHRMLQDVRVDGTAAPWIEVVVAAQSDAANVTSSGNGSLHYARGVPAAPSSVSLAGSAGTFTVTVTP